MTTDLSAAVLARVADLLFALPDGAEMELHDVLLTRFDDEIKVSVAAYAAEGDYDTDSYWIDRDETEVAAFVGDILAPMNGHTVASWSALDPTSNVSYLIAPGTDGAFNLTVDNYGSKFRRMCDDSFESVPGTMPLAIVWDWWLERGARG